MSQESIGQLEQQLENDLSSILTAKSETKAESSISNALVIGDGVTNRRLMVHKMPDSLIQILEEMRLSGDVSFTGKQKELQKLVDFYKMHSQLGYLIHDRPQDNVLY